MDLIVLVIFTYMIYRMAAQRGIPTLGYVLNYIFPIILLDFCIAFIMLRFYGPEWMKSDEGVKTAMMFQPFTLLFEVLLFVYFRKRIQKVIVEDEDENLPAGPTDEKKDFSYFR